MDNHLDDLDGPTIATLAEIVDICLQQWGRTGSYLAFLPLVRLNLRLVGERARENVERDRLLFGVQREPARDERCRAAWIELKLAIGYLRPRPPEISPEEDAALEALPVTAWPKSMQVPREADDYLVLKYEYDWQRQIKAKNSTAFLERLLCCSTRTVFKRRKAAIERVAERLLALERAAHTDVS